MARRPLVPKKPTPDQLAERALDADVEVEARDKLAARQTGKSPELHARARHTIETMLAHGIATVDIAERMARPPFLMSSASVKNAIYRQRRRWREQDADRRGDYKLMAQERLLKTIAEARKEGHYAAVASLERELASIQGTREPERVQLDVDTIRRDAVERCLAYMKPEQIRVFAQQFRQRRAALGLKPGQPVPRALNHDGVIDADVVG
ncbi:MAG: hypothetical protein R3B72_05920 [Polyangiaceae bacterium]